MRAAQPKEPHKNSKTFCGDPILAQAVKPPLASRGAKSECRALDEYLSRHGRECASAEFLRPCRDFGEYCFPLGYVSAILKTLVEVKR